MFDFGFILMSEFGCLISDLSKMSFRRGTRRNLRHHVYVYALAANALACAGSSGERPCGDRKEKNRNLTNHYAILFHTSILNINL